MATILVALAAGAPAASADYPCPNAQFRVGPSASLPDCRAYELVSPADKGAGGYVGGLSLINNNVQFSVARSGEGISYEIAYPPEATAGGPLVQRADRSSTGWSSTQITPPALVAPFQTGGFSLVGAVTYTAPDLSCSTFTSYEPLTSDAPQAMIDAGQALMYRQDADGTETLLTPDVPANIGSASPLLPSAYVPQGVSADCEHIVFTTPFTYSGVGASGLYEWTGGELRNVGVRPDGSVASGATLGYTRFNAGSVWNAVSADGSRIFFSATSNAGGDSGKQALFLREDGQSTVDVSQSETATVNQGALFQLASKTGDHVLFLANYGLTSTSSVGPTTANCTTSATACDLYDYDVDTGDLANLSADANPDDINGATVAGVLGASDDASHVYFAAKGQLVSGEGNTYAKNVADSTYNVYLTHGGVPSFVGVLKQSDLTAAPSGALITNSTGTFASWRSRVTPDGRHLLFSSTANVTGYDSGGVSEAYLYSADSDTTVCVSCRQDGNPSVGSTTAPNATAPLPSAADTLSPLSPPVTLSDDGSRVFFTMPDVLASGAISGNANVYEWQDGEVSLLATDTAPVLGVGAASGLRLRGASASGDDVFITTGKQLAPHDTDLRYDAYDIRVDGGFPAAPAPPAICEVLAGGCHPGGASPLPVQSKTTSSSGSPQGDNVSPGVRKRLRIGKLSRKARKRAARTGVLRVRVRTNRAGLVRVLARARIGKRALRVAGRKVRLRETGTVMVKLRLNRAAKRRLRRGRTLRVTLRVASPGARPRTATVRLKRGKRS